MKFEKTDKIKTKKAKPKEKGEENSVKIETSCRVYDEEEWLTILHQKIQSVIKDLKKEGGQHCLHWGKNRGAKGQREGKRQVFNLYQKRRNCKHFFLQSWKTLKF